MIKSVNIKFEKFLHDTGKAILIRINGIEHWIPKKLCRKLIVNKKLGGNVCVPSFIYERITGELPTETDAETIIEKHIPVRINPINTLPNAELIR